MSPPVEYRTVPAAARLQRAPGARGTAAARAIGGTAIVFDQVTTIGDFREVVRSGAIRLDRDRDVKLLWDHHSGSVLGRTLANTLKLSHEPGGLVFGASLPSWAAGHLETLGRRDVSGCSFAFLTLSDEWSWRDGKPFRALLDVVLIEISLVAFPAYPGTSVAITRGGRSRPRPPASRARDRVFDLHAQDRLRRVAAA